VGRRLVTDSLRWAREQQFVGMQFNAVAETNERAVQLYESLGFTIVGTVPGAFRHPRQGRRRPARDVLSALTLATGR
jgi:ribosomal protein S18 acetylase RimI-like enzyme